MNSSPSIAKLAGALSAAQRELQPAVKDSTNPAFRSKYADLGAVWDACREAITNHGLSVAQLPTTVDAGYVALETVLMHESGEWISSTVQTKLVKDDPQGVGSALTYLRRYALSAMIGIVADEDDDGHAASTGPRQQNRQLPPRGPRASQPAPTENAAKPSGVVIALNRELQERYEFKANEREQKLQFIRWAAKLPSLASSKDLTDDQAESLLKRLKAAEPAEILERWAEYESARPQAS